LIRHPEKTCLMTSGKDELPVDVAFPLVHGPMGEDGTLQGMLELMGLPYVGSGVLASAVGMDKDILKRMLAHSRIPVAPMVTVSTNDPIPDFNQVCEKLNSKILFIKPAIMGSSVGISKVSNKAQFEEAIQQAFRYSFKVLIEKFIPGREVECSVLGNVNPTASCVGEIKPTHDFYSYEAKYLDADGAKLIVPAQLPELLAHEVREMAVAAFKAIECKGFARVDFFISDDGKVYVNELNTIPGFTAISMYPKMWEASGICYTDLISQLIDLAGDEYEAKQTIHLRPDVTFDVPNTKDVMIG
jgi:D-alanine-D-alanine ligase